MFTIPIIIAKSVPKSLGLIKSNICTHAVVKISKLIHIGTVTASINIA
jgi:hypothetical protein